MVCPAGGTFEVGDDPPPPGLDLDPGEIPQFVLRDFHPHTDPCYGESTHEQAIGPFSFDTMREALDMSSFGLYDERIENIGQCGSESKLEFSVINGASETCDIQGFLLRRRGCY